MEHEHWHHRTTEPNEHEFLVATVHVANIVQIDPDTARIERCKLRVEQLVNNNAGIRFHTL